MITLEIIALAPLASDRMLDARRGLSETEPTMPDTSHANVRLGGLVAALRFAWLPIACALVVALASTDPRGRVLAAVVGFAVLVTGLVLNARQIVTGRAASRDGVALTAR